VKLVRGSREIGRADVQELRKDLAHYSAQMGLVLAPGEAGRDARSEASAAGQAPVALYAGEALPEEMIACRVGVTVQSVEVPDVDEAFFAGLLHKREERSDGRSFHRRDREERAEEAAPAATPEPAATPAVQPEPAASPEPAPAPEAQEAAPEEPPAPAEPAGPSAQGDEPREARGKRRGGRDERPRATTPAEQAWGQPAGTLRFAPPPGPTVVDVPTLAAEEARPDPAEEPAAPPPPSKPDEF